MIIFHADDIGASKGVTDSILETIDHGVVRSVSILANGHAFEYAVKLLKQRPGVRVVIHLNIVEGRPLCPKQEIPDLVGDNGCLNASFVPIWFKYAFASFTKRDSLKTQIKREFKAQIEKVRRYFPEDFPVELDSHGHVHLIPFIFDILLELNRDVSIHSIRVPEEPMFYCFKAGRAWKNYLGPNIIKHYTAKVLSIGKKERLAREGIEHGGNFVGLLFSGNMNLEAVRYALTRLKREDTAGKRTEILFHPGGASIEEGDLWRRQKFHHDFYLSRWRSYEKNELKKVRLKELSEWM